METFGIYANDLSDFDFKKHICLSLKFLLSYFRSRAKPAERSIFGAGGREKIMDLMGKKNEQIKFKMFAIP